jgi:hypothetical protein
MIRTRVAIFIAVCSIAVSARADLFDLHPRPKAGYDVSTGMVFTAGAGKIVIADTPKPSTLRALAFLQTLLKERLGDTVRVISYASWKGEAALIVGQLDESGVIDTVLLHRTVRAMPVREGLPGREGYVIDIQPTVSILVGMDSNGVFNAASTFVQLLRDVGPTTMLRGVHVWDEPDYPNRWIFSQHNLRGANAMTQLKAITDTMARHKLNGIQQNDWKYNAIESQPKNWFDSVNLLKSWGRAKNFAIIPGVCGLGWSDGILYNDPNLAEGVQAEAKYVIESDTGRLIPDPNVSIPNGSFEAVNGNAFTGWSWYDNTGVTPDNTVKHGGTYSAKCDMSKVAGANCRFNRVMTCQPHRSYVITAWVKTQGFKAGMTQILVAGTDNSQFHSLTYTNFDIPATTDWMRVQVVFNTFDHTQIGIYAGEWSGASGTIWWDDIQMRDAGLTNVLRRAGTPVHVYGASGNREYREGIDVAALVDPLVASRHGSYGPYHEPPTLRRLTTGSINNGDTVRALWFHPLTTVADVEGNGSVMACVSEDTLYRIMRKQMHQLDSIYNPSVFFMGHDEIRNMNRDSACLKRGVAPSVLLADNLVHCKALIDSVHAGATSMVWSDMFDSLHNATNNYYLINGDLRGDWNLIPNTVTIVNWNSTYAKQSMNFFAALHHRQMSSPYYDVGNTSTIRAWRIAQEGVPWVDGMLYTTWASDYRFLPQFGDYAWSAGPAICHLPIDSASVVNLMRGQSASFSCEVEADPYDPSDSISQVWLHTWTAISYDVIGRDSVQLVHDVGNSYKVTYTPENNSPVMRYWFRAWNKQGITREGTSYVLPYTSGVNEGARVPTSPLVVSCYPNPSTTGSVVTFTPNRPAGAWTACVVDLVGRTVYTATGRVASTSSISLDLPQLPLGTYRCEVLCGSVRGVVSVVVLK